MKSSMTMMINVTGLFLIAFIGLGQADVDPGQLAQENIRQQIQIGVDTDNIIFREIVNGVLQVGVVLSKQRVCSKITKEHNTFNAQFLGVKIHRDEYMRAFLNPLKYNTDKLNNWAGTHCGKWTTLVGPSIPDTTVPDNALWEDVSSQLGVITQDVTYSHRGVPPPTGAFNKVDGTVCPLCP